jgi:hypothetical protein
MIEIRCLKVREPAIGCPGPLSGLGGQLLELEMMPMVIYQVSKRVLGDVTICPRGQIVSSAEGVCVKLKRHCRGIEGGIHL